MLHGGDGKAVSLVRHAVVAVQAEQVKMVVYLLKKQLLVQLHTYVFLLPSTSLSQRSRVARYLQLPSFDETDTVSGTGISSDTLP